MIHQALLILDVAKYFGGANVRVVELARMLHGTHRYAVATLADSPVQQRLAAEGLHTLPLPYRRADPRLLPYLVLAIRAGGFTVLDAHNPQAQWWGCLAARLTGITAVATVHSDYGSEHHHSLKGHAYESVLRLNNMAHSRFIAVSENVVAALQRIGITHNVHLIHNSLAIPHTTNQGRNHPLFVAAGWDESHFVITSVARLEPIKGHTHIIEAVRRVVTDTPHVRCMLVGDGRARAELETQVARAGLQHHVLFAGFRDDVADILAASDLFCLASDTEGLPFALLEASLLHIPLLVTQVGGMAALLEHRHTAYMVPPASPAALADGIRWAVAHPHERHTMAQTCFTMCRARFSSDKMRDNTLRVYGWI